MPGKMPRPSGACPMPATTRLCPGIRLMSVPSNVIVPAESGRRPEIVLRVVVLPAPLAPMRATISPAVHGQCDVGERRDLAVVHLHAVEVKKHREPPGTPR